MPPIQTLFLLRTRDNCHTLPFHRGPVHDVTFTLRLRTPFIFLFFYIRRGASTKRGPAMKAIKYLSQLVEFCVRFHPAESNFRERLASCRPRQRTVQDGTHARLFGQERFRYPQIRRQRKSLGYILLQCQNSRVRCVRLSKTIASSSSQDIVTGDVP